jgi:dynein heavy chain 1
MPKAYDGVPSVPSHREAVANAFVYIHDTLHQANHRLQKKGTRTTTITPRHYLDFILQFTKLYREKRSELEDQQRHLNIGLQKIKETLDQVNELQKSLAVKHIELKNISVEVDLKLVQMMNERNEADEKKKSSQELQILLNVSICLNFKSLMI